MQERVLGLSDINVNTEKMSEKDGRGGGPILVYQGKQKSRYKRKV